MKARLLLSILLLLCKCAAQAQSISRLDSICVYEYYVRNGFTTAGARSEFSALATSGCGKNRVEADPLNRVLNRARVRKHHQTKFGAQPQLFCLFMQQGQEHKVVINPPAITDLTDHKEYWIDNEADLKWLDSLIAGYFDKQRH